MLYQHSNQEQPQAPYPGPGRSYASEPPVKRHEWWRAALIIVGAVVALVLIVVVIITLGVRSMQTSQQDDMYQIVHSKEADKAFREDLKNMDPLAFTDKGVIHSYEIDNASISHNPMGGINVVLYVNGDKELDESVTLDRYNGEGPLEVGGSSSSVKLYDLIGLNNQRYGITSPLYPDDVAKEYAEQLKKLNQTEDKQTEGQSGRNGGGDE